VYLQLTPINYAQNFFSPTCTHCTTWLYQPHHEPAISDFSQWD